MARRIALLVAAMTAAIVLVFLLPLGFLVRDLAYDRARAAADQEARNIAILVSSLHETAQLDEVVAAVDARSPATSSVVFAEGRVIGDQRIDAKDADVVEARTGAAFSRRTADAGLRIVVPVLTSNGTDVVVTEVTEEQLDEGVHAAWAVLAGMGVVLIGLAAAVAARTARRIATPVREVAAVADRLREGDLDARAAVEGTAETRALAEALNRLGGRIQELLVAERGVAGDLAHRLRTPVTALRIDVDRIPDDELAERLRDHLATLQRTVDLIVEDARRPVRHAMDARADVGQVLADRIAFWEPLAEDQSRPLDSAVPVGQAPVAVDPSDLSDLVDVLIDNVFAHTAEGVGFSVRGQLEDASVAITVTDQGAWQQPGTSGPGHSGLGLQLVRRLVETVGGEMQVDGDADGTRVRVVLPLTD